MSYFIKRGEQNYGPYTLAELQRYVQSGNISLQDMAQSEGVEGFVPVSQVLGNIPVAPTPIPPQYVNNSYAAPSPVAQPSGVPLPPDLHWALVLLLHMFTFGLFPIIWVIVQANWVRKFRGNSRPLTCLILAPILGVAAMFLWAVAVAVSMSGQGNGASGAMLFAALLYLGMIVTLLMGIFGIRKEMHFYYNQVENIGLHLGGVMTFFFHVFYFQYHVNRLWRWKKTGMLS
jgi:hypothetical protein